jgi:hypothetical protein
MLMEQSIDLTVLLAAPAGQFANASQTIGVIFHVICNNTWNDTTQGYVSIAAVANQVAVLNQCVSSPACSTCRIRVLSWLIVCAYAVSWQALRVTE